MALALTMIRYPIDKRKVGKFLSIACLLSVLGLPFRLFGQPVGVYAEYTYASYSMEDFKKIQDNIVFLMLGNERIDVEHRIFHNFPPHPAIDFGIEFNLEKFTLGLVGGYYSTGSRWHYSDYSAELRFDQLVTSTKLGIEVRDIYSIKSGRLSVTPSAQVGLMMSNLAMDNAIDIYIYRVLTEKLDVKAKQVYFLPSIVSRYHLKWFFLSSHIGYHLQISSSANKVSSAIDSWDTYSFHEKKSFNWGGLRAGIGIGFTFNYSSTLEKNNN